MDTKSNVSLVVWYEGDVLNIQPTTHDCTNLILMHTFAFKHIQCKVYATSEYQSVYLRGLPLGDLAMYFSARPQLAKDKAKRIRNHIDG